MTTISAAEYRTLSAPSKRRKYGNSPVVVDGERFDSKAEAARWSVLQLRQRAGEICALRRQPRYPLHAYGGEVIGEYWGDFEYIVPNEGMVTEDVKSPATAADKLFVWKRKHFEAEYRRPIIMVGKFKGAKAS